MRRFFLLLAVNFFFLLNVKASRVDDSGQIIRGTVVDKQTQMPLPGANVVLLESDPLIVTATNQEGEFRLTNVSYGR